MILRGGFVGLYCDDGEKKDTAVSGGRRISKIASCEDRGHGLVETGYTTTLLFRLS